jgi:hypothetical protein
MRYPFALCAAALAASLATPAQATVVHIEVRGTVDYSLIQGALANVPDGAPVVMGFDVDSTDFVNSSNFPTRGYTVNLASFDLNIGGVHLQLDNPQSGSTPVYFVLRDNDPAVDGFFLTRGGVENPFPLDMHIPGLAPVHEFEFARSFDVGTVLHSLNILDAVGTYGFENMGSYLWTIGRFGNPGTEVAYQSITITAVPEPAAWALFGLGLAALSARRVVSRARPAATR